MAIHYPYLVGKRKDKKAADLRRQQVQIKQDSSGHAILFI
jgi:hypothetical protein